MHELTAIVLAAGASRRFGQSKQLLPWQGGKLIEHIIAQLKACAIPVNVILGANAENIRQQLAEDKSNHVCFETHNNWSDGIGSSISFAISRLQANTQAALITLADQIAITSEHYISLIKRWQQQPKQIVTAYYDQQCAVPAIFPRAYFSELQNLHEDKGAKNIIKQHQSQVISIDMPAAAIDIDTPDDWQQWQSQH